MKKSVKKPIKRKGGDDWDCDVAGGAFGDPDMPRRKPASPKLVKKKEKK